jgi:hypothetical protein
MRFKVRDYLKTTRRPLFSEWHRLRPFVLDESKTRLSSGIYKNLPGPPKGTLARHLARIGGLAYSRLPKPLGKKLSAQNFDA